MLRHAQVWKHINTLPSDTLEAHVKTLDYGLPIFGALAGNPKTTAKDVIKATSGAVADGHLTPSAAVGFISDMPADPEKLQSFLRDRYAGLLTEAIHAKAALLSRAQPMPQGAPQPQPQVMQPPMQQPGAVS